MSDKKKTISVKSLSWSFQYVTRPKWGHEDHWFEWCAMVNFPGTWRDRLTVRGSLSTEFGGIVIHDINLDWNTSIKEQLKAAECVVKALNAIDCRPDSCRALSPIDALLKLQAEGRYQFLDEGENAPAVKLIREKWQESIIQKLKADADSLAKDLENKKTEA